MYSNTTPPLSVATARTVASHPLCLGIHGNIDNKKYKNISENTIKFKKKMVKSY